MAPSKNTREIPVPDIGDVDDVEVLEILVAPGDTVAVDDALITLESDKASMDVPSPEAGTVKEIRLSAGDPVKEGDVILTLEAAGAGTEEEEKGPGGESREAEAEAPAAPSGVGGAAGSKPETVASVAPAPAAPTPSQVPTSRESRPSAAAGAGVDEAAFAQAYASPSVRKLARELGADLGRVPGTGRKGRIVPSDLKAWVKRALEESGGGAGAAGGGIAGFDWPAMPEIDFSKFGDVEVVPMSRIAKVSARNLHRSWLHVPHVTQHEEADVTEMEAFRKGHAEEAKKKGFRLTPLAFLMKATATALAEYPRFNSSLHPDGDKLVLKKYCHLGVAVDTPDGLVVPVIRDVDRKGLYQLAEEVVDASVRAREGKLMPKDFQGATFTISSLGGIGGTAFTPIVNAPEVGILGVSRTRMRPVWNGSEFEPRLMLPLSVSYDHRVVDGAYACRFTVHLAGLLSDLRKLLL
ncbi:MAG: dihydrolipoyllysine-residue acetyltransferase [Holophagales bacterium]|nr:dihydrolipoyllysine-residue acetyltransferase [Holophagales bacterium]